MNWTIRIGHTKWEWAHSFRSCSSYPKYYTQQNEMKRARANLNFMYHFGVSSKGTFSPFPLHRSILILVIVWVCVCVGGGQWKQMSKQRVNETHRLTHSMWVSRRVWSSSLNELAFAFAIWYFDLVCEKNHGAKFKVKKREREWVLLYQKVQPANNWTD